MNEINSEEITKKIEKVVKKARFWIGNLVQKISSAFSRSRANLKKTEHKVEIRFKEFGHKASENFTEFEHKAAEKISHVASDVKNFEQRAEIGLKDFGHKAGEKMSHTMSNLKDFEQKAEVGLKDLGHKAADNVKRAADKVKDFEHKAEEKVKKVVEGVKGWEHRAADNVKSFEHKVEEKISKAAVDVKNWEHAAEDNVKEFEHKAVLNVKKLAESVKHIRPSTGVDNNPVDPQKKIKTGEKLIPEKTKEYEPITPTKKFGFTGLLRKIELTNPVKILIIEDEEVLAEVLKEKLKKANLEVKIAKDGEEAISMAKSFEPDVIVLDLLLPKVSGFEVLKQVKADERLSRIPVVVLSNLSDDENIKKAMNMGAMDYFVKANHPINEIVEKIKGTLLKAK